MRTILASIVGSIITITFSKVILIWLGSQLGVNPEHWIAKLFGVAERGVTAYPAISIILLGFVCLNVLLIGFLFYKLSTWIFGREYAAARRNSTRVSLKQSRTKRFLQILLEILLQLIVLIPKLLIIIILNILIVLFPRLLFPKRQLVNIMLPKKHSSVDILPVEQVPEKKQVLPKQFPKDQLNDWRADLKTIKTLRAIASGNITVRISYTDIRNYLFSERLAIAFKESGWKVSFRKNAHEKNFQHYNGCVEVKGDDSSLVVSIAVMLEASGCVSAKKSVVDNKLGYSQSISHTYYYSNQKLSQKDIFITIGYQELGLTSAA